MAMSVNVGDAIFATIVFFYDKFDIKTPNLLKMLGWFNKRDADFLYEHMYGCHCYSYALPYYDQIAQERNYT